jgi:eukaryotic-like serine/threonine-protein kinase
MNSTEVQQTSYMEAPPKSVSGEIPEPAVPRRLGKYPLLSVIGKGSMGVVYKSLDPHTKRAVAVKTIRHELLGDDVEDFPARLRIEAQAVKSFSHPGIVAIHEYGEDAGYAYVVMEYVEGRSLKVCFEQGVRFSVGEAIDIQSQLLQALQYAHDRGLWHRGLNPANILITNNGRVRVTDFGIARIDVPTVTQPNALMGTPGYVAPEVYLTGTVDGRIDVFAAGAVLYQLLASVPPYVGTLDKIMLNVCYETPLPPSVAARQPQLVPFDTVVMQALARPPEARFPSAERFLAALLQVHHAPGDRPVDADETMLARRPFPSSAISAEVGATLIAPAAASAEVGATLIAPAAASESAGPPPSAGNAPGATWDMDELARIQHRLAAFVGPIARVMVSRAARETDDLVALNKWLAAKISRLPDRERFLKDAGIAPVSAGASAGRQPGGAAPAGRPLTREDIARASGLLAVHVGPIATILAKRAAQPGCSREQFLAALAVHLGNDHERARFLGSLG